MGKLIDTIFGSGKKTIQDVDDFVELDLRDYEEGIETETAKCYIKIAELTGLEVMPALKKQIYEGNILMIDILPTKKDKIAFDRAIKDLKQVVNDVHGDIAMIKEDQVIVTPRGIKIDRLKIK